VTGFFITGAKIMARFLKKKEGTIGQVPGELVFIGEQKVSEATVKVIDYDKESFGEQ
jgi:magnesium transporter